jgi:hypothetical protein
MSGRVFTSIVTPATTSTNARHIEPSTKARPRGLKLPRPRIIPVSSITSMRRSRSMQRQTVNPFVLPWNP